MNRIFAFGLSLAFGSALHAQAVNVHGKISNGSGGAVANAVVELARQAVKDTTGADGMYSLVKASVAIRSASAAPSGSMRLENGILELTVGSSAPIKVEVFDLSGNSQKKDFIPNAQPGVYRTDIASLHSKRLRIVKASIGPLVQTFRYFPGLEASSGDEGAIPSARTAGRFLARTAAAVDTLQVSAAGYETKKIALSSFDTTVNVVLGAKSKVVSYVDLSLNNSQKFMRVVDGKPYWGTEIQVRLDKLTYRRNWNATGRAAIMAQAAADGFNTVGIPINWYEIEPTKDKFDWTILDEYLGLCKKNNLKMELLWFSMNSGAKVQWLGESYKPVHLRVPDYVLYSPSPSSNATTSEFKKTGSYQLDLKDNNLRARETYVVSKLMAHVASWDAANGSPHTVIGIQLGNEVYEPYAGDVQVAYYSAVAAAVKSSSYVIWTRMNNWTPHTKDQINANEALRKNGGTNVDFIGDDTYFEGERADWMIQAVPPIGKNYQMMMEIGADVPIVPQLCLAALSGNTAFSYYDMCGPDGHGLYVETGVNTFKPNGSYVNTLRTLNRLLNSDVYDIARLKAQSSSGMFVHNWAGNSTSATTGVRGVGFTPSLSSSQAISMARSSTEIVLINTLGGRFNYPASLQVSAASTGYFDANDIWVPKGDVAFTSTSITPPEGSTVRLVVAATGQ